MTCARTIQPLIVFFLPFFADVDECALQTHNCAAGSVCENKVGSFVCNAKPQCMAGFSADDHGNCVGKEKSDTRGLAIKYILSYN